MLAPVGLLVLVVAAGGRCERAVAANVGHHAMSRIAELLSPAECRRLRGGLEQPEVLGGSQEKKKNQHRALRGRSGCSESLRLWLETAGEVTTWDRLTRVLHQIGRSDIARELGKNLNQDRSLELKRNVEEYGRSLQHSTSSLLLDVWEHGGERGRRAPEEEGDPGDLLFERRPPPPYTRSLLGWVGPVVSGILGGFLISLLFTVGAACSWRWTLGSGGTGMWSKAEQLPGGKMGLNKASWRG
ncbi:transmembrane and death domain protein 1 [Heliangelus exortis]|uniref:transmembrane and death domain protein 1 n=1 Tax=Heliangelus exortis TaxID=472823 RepID=UPI003A8E62F7